jgi:hypothetical protein
MQRHFSPPCDSAQHPYKGMAPAMNDLLSGEIAVGFVNITAQVVALHRGGKIRILAVNAPARLEAVPDIPRPPKRDFRISSRKHSSACSPPRAPRKLCSKRSTR